jgi:hypothetical protein
MSRKKLNFKVAACAALALFATAWPAFANEPASSQGPVGPNQALVAAFGGKRVVAFYSAEKGRCAVNAVVWDKDGEDATRQMSSMRVRFDLAPGETFHFDSTGTDSLNVKCGDNAATLAIGN